MSIKFYGWEDKARKDARAYENIIINNKIISYGYWDFSKNIRCVRNRKLYIAPWHNQDEDEHQYSKYQKVQYEILCKMGRIEIDEKKDLSDVKREFMIMCSEIDVSYPTEKVINILEYLYLDDKSLCYRSKKATIDHNALLAGMILYDFTNNFIEPKNRIGFHYSDLSYRIKNMCGYLYNTLAEREVLDIARSALYLSAYSGMKGSIIFGRDEVQNLLRQKQLDREFDLSFLEQINCCIESMLVLLNSCKEPVSFKDQFMECMVALYHFGSNYRWWYIRNHDIKF